MIGMILGGIGLAAVGLGALWEYMRKRDRQRREEHRTAYFAPRIETVEEPKEEDPVEAMKQAFSVIPFTPHSWEQTRQALIAVKPGREPKCQT